MVPMDRKTFDEYLDALIKHHAAAAGEDRIPFDQGYAYGKMLVSVLKTMTTEQRIEFQRGVDDGVTSGSQEHLH